MQHVDTIHNPYWEELQGNLAGVVDGLFAGNYSIWEQRKKYYSHYCWAVPDPETLAFTLKWLSPSAIEIGAGTGYWANQLATMGLDILAFDAYPPDKIHNHYHHSIGDESGLWTVFYPVQEGNATTLKEYPDRTLFLCWPPYDNAMAHECLSNYPGQKVIYIGEGDGGCTGDEAFHKLLDDEWHLVAEHIGIQWDGIHDRVYVYERGAGEEYEGEASMSTRPPKARQFYRQ
jgi:hypothetical protein